MRRSLLITLMALGAVVTLLSTTGVIAVFNDSADTPENSFTTGELAATADIVVGQADAALQTESCDVLGENFDLAFFSTGGEPGTNTAGPHICIRNVGSGSVALSVLTFDVADTETGCTGDEGAVDTTCGVEGGVAQEGELSSVVSQDFFEEDCATGQDIRASGDHVDALGGSGFSLNRTIAPDEEVCFHVILGYHPAPAAATIAQTDELTWKLRFTGTAA